MANQLEELLKRYANQVARNSSNVQSDAISLNENIAEKINTINEGIIRKEEQQKLVLRDRLTKTVTKFIWAQLIFFNFVILAIVLSVTMELQCFKSIDNSLATLLFDFLKYYIGATIVELLGMLGFILHYIFSKFERIEKARENK